MMVMSAGRTRHVRAGEVVSLAAASACPSASSRAREACGLPVGRMRVICGLAAAVLIGALARLLPALKAARLSPTEALWTL
jgi:hypothetical protein